MKESSRSFRFFVSTVGHVLPRLLVLLVVAFAGSLTEVAAAAKQYQEVRCPAPVAHNTPVWRNFEDFVSREYAHGKPVLSLSPDARALAMGHALGRAAMAVQDDPDRREAFACLERAMDLTYTAPVFFDPSQRQLAKRLYDLANETSQGKHDDLVRRYTGVTATSAAYVVFGATAPPPLPPKQLPLTPIAGPTVQHPPVVPSNPQAAPEIGYCKAGAYSGYSVAKARMLADKADADSKALPATCYSTADYLACKKVSDLLYSAIDQLTQVMQVSRSSVGQGCRYCDLSRQGYPAIGRLIDTISRNLDEKGFHSAPAPNLEWHFSTMVRQDLCKTPPLKGSFAISPVARDECPKHCGDAAPECRYAYYRASTQTCSWIDNQSAPNLLMLDAAEIWDRPNRKWLTRSNSPPPPTPPPSGPGFVLDRVVFSKGQSKGDLCKADMTCRHDRLIASGWELDHRYTISAGMASFRFTETYQRTREVVSNFSVQFNFEAPPTRLRPGETLRLKISGNAIGFTKARFYDRSFTYYLKQGARNNYQEKTMVNFSNRELPHDGTRSSGQLSKASTTEITIPKNAGKELVIGGRSGRDPGLFIDWIYKAQ